MKHIEAAIVAYIEKVIGSKSFTQSLLYKVLKRDLTKLGYWKAKPRGKPDVNNFGKETSVH